MRMSRQLIMNMLLDTMMYFTGCTERVNVDGGVGKILQIVEELMPNILGNFMSLFHAQI